MSRAASVSLAKARLPLGFLGSLAVQGSIRTIQVAIRHAPPSKLPWQQEALRLE